MPMKPPAVERPDRLARALETGLGLWLFAAPLPLGAASGLGRAGVEWAALALGALWLVRALVRPTVLPPRAVQLGLAGLLVLGLVQTLPLGPAVVGTLSPQALRLREAVRADETVADLERAWLGVDPASLETAPALSVDPRATREALRTGTALVALVLCATTVARVCGLERLAWWLTAAAAFQALYGILALASGQARIWHIPKRYYLDSATGTFVNRNHFAAFLAGTLPAAAAAALPGSRGREPAGGLRRRLLALGEEGAARALMLSVLLALGAAGLLVSFSRAGTALGVVALAWTALVAGRRRLRRPAVALALLLACAAVPLAQIGADRLAARYGRAVDDVAAAGGRVTVWRDTLRLAAAFPVAGTGFGTFERVYPSFRSPEVRLHYSHAHSEPLQWLAEGGLVGALLLLAALVPLLRRAVACLSGSAGALPVGLAAGLAAIGLHGFVDFPLRIPALAGLAAVLAGAVLGARWNTR